MAGLPAGYAEEVASEQPLRGYGRWTDGDYILLIREVTYDEVKTKSGKEMAHKIMVRVVESKPLANKQPEDVQPVAVGTDIDIFWPDYGNSKIMTKKKVIAFVLGLTGVDQKTTDKMEIAKTTTQIWDPQVQLARGMLIRAETYRFELKNPVDGEDGIGHNFFPVPGENHPHAESVKKRRAELDAERANGGRPSQPASAPTPPITPVAPPPPPSAPPPAPPPAPPVDPMAALFAAGWKIHPDDANYLWRGTEVKPKADLLAGR